jgi:predicted outer membrane protein
MQQQPSGTNPGMGATQMSPQQFALTVGSANKFEVIEGELALAQASDAKLKDFARMMVKDHAVALQELQAAAKAANIVLPPDIALDAVHQAKINAIRNRKGADFDQAYRTDQVQAHQQTIAILDTYATAGGNPALKAWTAKAYASTWSIWRLWEWAAGRAEKRAPVGEETSSLEIVRVPASSRDRLAESFHDVRCQLLLEDGQGLVKPGRGRCDVERRISGRLQTVCELLDMRTRFLDEGSDQQRITLAQGQGRCCQHDGEHVARIVVGRLQQQSPAVSREELDGLRTGSLSGRVTFHVSLLGLVAFCDHQR